TGEQPGVEEYLARFPALCAEPELIVDLAYAEYLIREETGGQPLAAEYERRFPEQSAVLTDQIGLHEAIYRAARKPAAVDDPAEAGPCCLATSRTDVAAQLA